MCVWAASRLAATRHLVLRQSPVPADVLVHTFRNVRLVNLVSLLYFTQPTRQDLRPASLGSSTVSAVRYFHNPA